MTVSRPTRVDIQQVREAIKHDCRGTAWWRVLVGDLLDELNMTRWECSDASSRAAKMGVHNDDACDEIARLRNWIRHWQESGWVEDELQMALDGDASPLCSPKTPDRVPGVEQVVTQTMCGSCGASLQNPDEACEDKCRDWMDACEQRARSLAPNIPAEIRRAGLGCCHSNKKEAGSDDAT